MSPGAEKHWRFLDSGFNSGPLNMALDQVLLQSESNSGSVFTLRFYGWRPPALSLGYFQRIEPAVAERCRARGIDVVRRLTGGRAVLHDRELTYSVTGPVNGVLGRSVREIYLKIGEALVLGLQKLGAAAELVDPHGNKPESRRGYVMKAACFASQTQGEIAVGKMKVVGSAQRQVGGRFLQHGSVPLAPPRVAIEDLFGVELPEKNRSSMTLTEASGRPVGYREVADALKASFAERFAVTWQEAGLTPAERQTAGRLAEERYRRMDWSGQNQKLAVV